MKLKKIKDHLTGIEALQLIQKGHAVRRACWVKDFFIRVTNEDGFDEQGNLIVPKQIIGDKVYEVSLYTHATSGYFMHVGSSPQPFAFEHTIRSGEGIAMFFENDWEDYGFISSDNFNELTEQIKERVRKEERKFIKLVE